MPNRDLDIVVPTYREAANLPELAERTFAALDQAGIEGTLYVVDDDSRDGTDEVCANLASRYAVKLITRVGERGLATAVLRGIESSSGRVILVMDADLSHPPEKIPELYGPVAAGDADFAVGSRFIDGARVDGDWSLFRWLNSKIASLLAAGLTELSDPMSGFFAFPRSALEAAPQLSPVGYKIGLEICTKCRCQRLTEVPIHFEDRWRGESKLTLEQQILYLRHLRRLYRFAHPQLAELLQFAAVGATGVVLDLLLYLTAVHVADIHHQTARAISFASAASLNWYRHRWLTWVGDRPGAGRRHWSAYLFSSSVGFAVNWGSYKYLTDQVVYFSDRHLAAFFIGIGLGVGFSYMLLRAFMFRGFEEEIEGSRRDR